MNHHHFILGVCYRNCEPGFANHPLSCFKHLFHWYFKHSYVPHIITNFASEIPCDGDMYKSGALCYRNCETIGMHNCGIGACVASSGTCAMQIFDIGLKVLEGLATLITNIVTLGSSAGHLASLKMAGKAAIQKLGRKGIEMAKNAAKNAFTGQFRKRILQKARNKVKLIVNDKIKKFIKDNMISAAKTTLISHICEKVFATFSNQLEKDEKSINDEYLAKMISSVDIFGISGIIDGCKNTNEDGGLACGKAVVETASTLDPTGILSIAAAFIHPECDVPEKAPPEDKIELLDLTADETRRLEEIKKREEEEHLRKLNEIITTNREVEEIKKLKPNCIRVYTKINYEGEFREDCTNVPHLKSFDDKIESFITGSEVRGYMFEHYNYDGQFLKFGPGLLMRDVRKFVEGDINLKKMISSLYFGETDIIKFRFSALRNTFFLFKIIELNFMLIEYPKNEFWYDNNKEGSMPKGKKIPTDYHFITNYIADSVSMFMYKPKTVTLTYWDGKIQTFDKSFTLFAKDMTAPQSRHSSSLRFFSWK